MATDIRAIREAAVLGAEPSPDSIRAYSNVSLRETSPGPPKPLLNPIPWPELTASPDVDWFWRGFLAPGHVTLFLGLWKAGKSTLLAHLLVAFSEGGEVGTPVRACRILVLSEESGTLWAGRRQELNIEGAHVDLICRPFKGKPTWTEWRTITDDLTRLVRERHYDVVILDPLGPMWPVWKENDSGEVQGALAPLHNITEAGAAVLLVHHSRKGDGTEAQASRGSGALPAFCDIIMEFRRFDPERREDRRRVLTTYGRFDETEPELVLELAADGYRVCGTKADAKRGDRLAAAMDVLRDASKPLTVEELLADWTGDIPKPGKRGLQLDLNDAHEQGSVVREGTGKRNDPYRYSFRASSGSYMRETQEGGEE